MTSSADSNSNRKRSEQAAPGSRCMLAAPLRRLSLARLSSLRPAHAQSRPLRSTSTTMSTPPILPAIVLTPDEHKLVDLLVGCADWVDHNPHLVDALRLKDDTTGEWIGRERGDEPVELRIAGGWVRDKVSPSVSLAPKARTLGLRAVLFETAFHAWRSQLVPNDQPVDPVLARAAAPRPPVGRHRRLDLARPHHRPQVRHAV